MFEARGYNGFNQLISVFVDNVSAAYKYRPDGLRHSKETFDYKTTQNTVHLWDGANICAEQNTSGVFARYLRGVNLIARRQDNLNQYYHFNAHGDVVQRTDYNGVVLKNYDYDAFGVEKNLEPMDSNPFRYCGEYFDRETKDLYLRARYYDARLGRFGSEDPIGAGLNWYTYCGGNPVMFVDPLGLKIELPDAPNRKDYKSDKSYDKAKAKYDEAKAEYDRAIEYLMQSESFRELYNQLEESDEIIKIEFSTERKQTHIDGTIYWNPTIGVCANKPNEDGKYYIVSPAVLLAHEMTHAKQYLDGDISTRPPDYNRRQRNAIENENIIAKELGETPVRKPGDFNEGKYYTMKSSTDWGYRKGWWWPGYYESKGTF